MAACVAGVWLAGEAAAQTGSPFQPSLTDPRIMQGFAPPPTKPAAQPPRADAAVLSGAGVTGFDATGSIRKKQAKRKPGAPHPPPSAPPPLPGPPQAGHTSAPQIATRAPYANAYPNPYAPTRRPRPSWDDIYDPLGVRVGDMVLRPAIEIIRGYDNNAIRSGSKRGSPFTQVTPELQVRSQWSRHALGFDLRGSYTTYDSISSLNRPSVDTKLTGRIDVTRDTRIDLEGRLLAGTDNPGSPNLQADLAKLPIYTDMGATVGIGQRFNRWDVSVKGLFDRWQYQDSQLTDGTSASNKERNYNQYGVQARATYEVTPGLKPFVQLDADRRHHDTACDCNGQQRDSNGLTPKAGATFNFTRILTGEVSAGYLMRDYKDPLLPSLHGAVIDASLIWNATGLTTATFTANSRAEESVRAGVSGALKRDLGVQVDHAFRRWLIGTFRAGVGFDQYVGLERDDRRTSIGAALTYKLSREVWLKGDIRQEWLHSNVAGADYNATIFQLGLKLQR